MRNVEVVNGAEPPLNVPVLGRFGALLPLRLIFTDFTKRDSVEVVRSPRVLRILRRYCRLTRKGTNLSAERRTAG